MFVRGSCICNLDLYLICSSTGISQVKPQDFLIRGDKTLLALVSGSYSVLASTPGSFP